MSERKRERDDRALADAVASIAYVGVCVCVRVCVCAGV